MFKTKFSRRRKSWVPGFILVICIGLIAISQLTFLQGQKKLQDPVVRALNAKHARVMPCGSTQTLKVYVFFFNRTTCTEDPVENVKVELIRGCTTIAKGRTGQNGKVQLNFKIQCPPPHCYMIVKASSLQLSNPPAPYYGAVRLKP
jgi:hypothetical protein